MEHHDRSSQASTRHKQTPSTTEPGWAIYVLYLTSCLLALLSIKSFEERLNGSFDSSSTFLASEELIPSNGSTSYSQAREGELEAAQPWRIELTDWVPHVANAARMFSEQVIPEYYGGQWSQHENIEGIQGSTSLIRDASQATTDPPVRIPIWRQSFWNAHHELAIQILDSAYEPAIEHWTDLVRTWHVVRFEVQAYEREIELAQSLSTPLMDVRAPAPARAPSLGAISATEDVDTQSSGVHLFESWAADWIKSALVKSRERVRTKIANADRVPTLNASARVESSDSSDPEPNEDLDPIEITEPAVTVIPQPRKTAPAIWPYPELLANRVAELRDFDATYDWTNETLTLFDELSGQGELSSDEAAACLELLNHKRRELRIISDREFSTLRKASINSTSYSMQKWIEIWSLVHAASQLRKSTQPSEDELRLKRDAAVAALSTIERKLGAFQNADIWREFLELDALWEAFVSPVGPARPSELVDRVLIKIDLAELSEDQSEFLAADAVQTLRNSLRPFALTEVDLSRFMWQLELFEQRSWHMIEQRVQADIHRMRISDNPYLNNLAETLIVHYRNANVRIAISEAMLNQMVPRNQSFDEPVIDTILGAEVRGESNTSNQFWLSLVPDPQKLRVSLHASGKVQSRTRASKGFFVFHNRGLGRFMAEKDVIITPQDLFTNPARVAAQNQNRTTGVESDFDYLPFVGDLARTIALQQQNDVAPITRRIVERKMAGAAGKRFDQEVETRLASSRTRLEENVVTQLDQMAIALEPVDFRTTTERLIMRYRLSGNDQLAAFSARPMALASSWMSIQIHESAFNNLVRRLHVDGREFRIDELYEHLSEVTGRKLEMPGAIDPSVVLKFAPSDGIEFRFVEDRVQVTLRFTEIRVGRNARWKNVAIEADYLPQLSGLQLSFVRPPESTLRLPGRQLGFRDQMAIRTIFNKVFDVNQVLPATPERLLTDARFQDLEVSQCVIQDGWVGLSLGPR